MTLHLVPGVTPWNTPDGEALFAAGWRWCASGQRWYLVGESPAGDMACLCGVPAPPPEGAP